MPDNVAVMGTVEAPCSPDANLITIVFRIAPQFGGRYADLAGDFTAWAPIAMDRLPSGGFWLTLRLERGRRWRYRFLLDGERWMNDPNVCEFVTEPSSGRVSVLRT